MEVTKSNFSELLPSILETIESSSFLCVDGEFTGLHSGQNITAFDSPSLYYDKLRSGALNFLCVQIGLTAFRRNSESNKYTYRSYNFYVFPRNLGRSLPDKRFLCQSSSIDFLANNGFDFNKAFREGIPFLTKSEEDFFRESLEKKRKFAAANQACDVPIPEEHKELVKTTCLRLAEVLSPECEQDEISVDKCNGYIRKLVFQSIRKQYSKEELVVESKNGVLVSRKGISLEEQDRERQEQLDEEHQMIEDAVGFSKVIRAISQSNKLLVGHNLLLDLCHMVNSFLDPVPPVYSEFKEFLHFSFPKIVDTKYLCQADEIKDLISSSALNHVLDTISEPPFKIPPVESEEGYGYDLKNEQYHEAGYDAFVTGVIFLSLLSHLDHVGSGLVDVDSSRSLPKFLNKIVLMKTPDAYMTIDGPDVQPDRDHVFLVKMPPSWTNPKLAQLFDRYGSVHIWWIDDEKAWIALDRKEMAGEVKRTMCQRKKSNLPPRVVVTPYSRAFHRDDAERPGKRFQQAPGPAPKRSRTKDNNKTSSSDESPRRDPSSPGLEKPTQSGSVSSSLSILEQSANIPSSNFNIDADWIPRSKEWIKRPPEDAECLKNAILAESNQNAPTSKRETAQT